MVRRHLTTKGFDWGLVSRSLYFDNGTILTSLEKRYGNIKNTDYVSEVIKAFPDKISLGLNIKAVKKSLRSSESLTKALFDDSSDIKSLDSIFSDKHAYNQVFSEDCISQLSSVASNLFTGINPLTDKEDISLDSIYTPYIPLVVLTGTLPPQVTNSDEVFFNPNGTVTIAEFLDSLNAIEFRSNSDVDRHTSLDNISNKTDFFNEGYCRCVSTYSSPLFNLYTREELMKPITRLELAYITIFCWDRFIKKYGTPFDGDYRCGYSFNWWYYEELLSEFKDGDSFSVSLIKTDTEPAVMRIKEYLAVSSSNKAISMTEYKKDIQSGIKPVSYPMLIATLELYKQGLFLFGNSLSILKEVSRCELAYFLTKLAVILKK